MASGSRTLSLEVKLKSVLFRVKVLKKSSPVLVSFPQAKMELMPCEQMEGKNVIVAVDTSVFYSLPVVCDLTVWLTSDAFRASPSAIYPVEYPLSLLVRLKTLVSEMVALLDTS